MSLLHDVWSLSWEISNGLGVSNGRQLKSTESSIPALLGLLLTKHRRLGGLSRHFFLTILEAEYSKIKVPLDSFLNEDPPLGCNSHPPDMGHMTYALYVNRESSDLPPFSHKHTNLFMEVPPS